MPRRTKLWRRARATAGECKGRHAAPQAVGAAATSFPVLPPARGRGRFGQSCLRASHVHHVAATFRRFRRPGGRVAVDAAAGRAAARRRGNAGRAELFRPAAGGARANRLRPQLAGAGQAADVAGAAAGQPHLYPGGGLLRAELSPGRAAAPAAAGLDPVDGRHGRRTRAAVRLVLHALPRPRELRRQGRFGRVSHQGRRGERDPKALAPLRRGGGAADGPGPQLHQRRLYRHPLHLHLDRRLRAEAAAAQRQVSQPGRPAQGEKPVLARPRGRGGVDAAPDSAAGGRLRAGQAGRFSRQQGSLRAAGAGGTWSSTSRASRGGSRRTT